MRCFGCMEETVGDRACPLCGYKPEVSHNPDYLKPGSVLASRYISGALLRKNGESGLYIAFDNNTRQKVWIREYFPYTLARRDRSTGTVLPQEGCGAQYKALMSDFADVCNTVRRLGVSESVIQIEQVFSENNTMYAVYRYVSVVSLETWLAQKGGKLPPQAALKLLLPLFGTVANLHRAGEIHRGISPFTVYVDEQGELYLGDFLLPAARTGGSELEAELYNGYSAPEQYATNGWQGSWTDVYGLAAVFYRTVSGSVPPKATLIGPNRPLPLLTDMVERCPQQLSDAVEHAMHFDYEDRTQTVASFLSALRKEPESVDNTAVFDTSAVAEAAKKPKRDDDYNYAYDERAQRGSTFKFLATAMLLTVAVLFAFLYFVASTLMPGMFSSSAAPTSGRPPSSISQPVSGQQSSDTTASSSSEPSSEAPKTVPRFVGQEASVLQEIEEYKTRFNFDIREQFSNTYDEGIVYDQSPVEGTLMPNKGTVILYVSKGPVRLEMPNLVGMELEEAMKLLYDLEKEYDISLPMQDAGKIYNPNVAPGLIARTDPVAGEEFNPAKRTIQVYLSMDSGISESIDISSSRGAPSDSPNWIPGD